ncbi:hypothetical protein GWO43_30585 [candidate division KSB1 bacterium]|nr:hypothetical protein [candidate division KSB1 bacterium]NIR72942.1 hypothetical protein [candidate division KSB1 bacterium]NIS28241.1 hypothetical protein [candidate division KSB1 bacterium]NIT75130.1 hypothetical protein [candidate division KSB1 bacterium]NIU28918.1 hypothetical protein [candidate division KSB1 bacterium]
MSLRIKRSWSQRIWLRSTICLLLFTSPLISQTDWLAHQSSVFRINYTEQDKQIVKAFAELLETEYSKLVARSGIRFARPVHIFLTPSEQAFNQLTGHFIPDWGEGVADPARSVIVLKSPNLSHNYDTLPKLIRHELTHILVGNLGAAPHTIPKWFHEGMAIYFSYDEEFAGGKAISKALLTDSVVPLDEIDKVLKFHREKARLAYEESYSAILYMEKAFGERGIVDFLQELEQSKEFDDTFLQVFGIDLYEFELDWYHFIEDKYRWRFLIDFETFLWIFIPLMLILAFIAIRLRNRRILKRWEDEERLASP